MNTNMDALYDAVAQRGPVCVGLDTAAEYIPPAALRSSTSQAEAIAAFNTAVVDATLPHCACYKVQIAYYEALGLPGLRAYADTLRYVRARGAMVIADIKRGDIADTAARYAEAHFSGDFEADFVTLSPYMGMDSIDPWLAWADVAGKGAFVLMRTSNPGMRDFEYLGLAAGGRLYDAVGDRLSKIAASRKGERGFGVFGAVVGCTEKEEAERIRHDRPELFFLIPGYGAQGGGADGAARLLMDGNGGVVNASRSILRAWMPSGDAAAAPGTSLAAAAEAAGAATADMRDAIRAACASVGRKGKEDSTPGASGVEGAAKGRSGQQGARP